MGSATTPSTISYNLENNWKVDYSEDNGYTPHGHIKVTVHDRTADAARKMIYQTICRAAKDEGTWGSRSVGITYPEIDNNTSDDILVLETILSYLEDDDCDPDN